jgi:hypothetical protein
LSKFYLGKVAKVNVQVRSTSGSYELSVDKDFNSPSTTPYCSRATQVKAAAGRYEQEVVVEYYLLTDG